MGADYLYDLADTLLDEALAGLAEARTGHAPPTRNYVAMGDPVPDLGLLSCDEDGQLTVHISEDEGIEAIFRTGDGSLPGTECAFAPYATFCVTLFRCVPTLTEGGEAPSAVELDTSGRDLAIDAWCLYTHLATLWGSGDLFDGAYSSCKDVQWGDMFPLHPQGGTAGWRLCLKVQLNDSGPAEES